MHELPVDLGCMEGWPEGVRRCLKGGFLDGGNNVANWGNEEKGW